MIPYRVAMTRTFVAAVLVVPAIVALAVRASPEDQGVLSTPLVLRKARFDLRKKENLPTVVKALDEEVDYYTALRDEKKEEKRDKEAGDKPPAQKPNLKDVVKELKAMRKLAKEMQDGRIAYEQGARTMLELDWTMRDEFEPQYIARPSLDIGQLFYRFRYYTLNAVGRGKESRPARNLATGSSADISRVDPKPSTFWTKPTAIAQKDLYYGFGRDAMPSIAGQICTYDGPHLGYGFHPSFDVKAPDGTKWRTKFGEQSSAPFGSRLMWALGYPTQISDYCPEVRVKWDRRIFTEFNYRGINALYIKFAGLTLFNQADEVYQSPFPIVRYAVMKDGSRITTEQLQRGLFSAWLPPAPQQVRTRKVYDFATEQWTTVTEKVARPAHPDADPKYYDREFEKKIDYLVFIHANIRTKDGEEGVDQLGGWDYNFLDHQDLREVRSMAVIQGWIDNWDVRPGNNRLRMIKDDDGSIRLEHVVSDMGALFGNSSGLIRLHDGGLRGGLFQESPNAFTWVYTHPQRPDSYSVPIANYMPIAKLWPYYRMNIDDARWMARMMCQLTENQIKQAFIGSGYDAATARILLEKLASRRDHMIQDLGLEHELSLWRLRGEDRKLSYDPEKDAPFTAKLKDGSVVTARIDPQRYVVNGRLSYPRPAKK